MTNRHCSQIFITKPWRPQHPLYAQFVMRVFAIITVNHGVNICTFCSTVSKRGSSGPPGGNGWRGGGHEGRQDTWEIMGISWVNGDLWEVIHIILGV